MAALDGAPVHFALSCSPKPELKKSVLTAMATSKVLTMRRTILIIARLAGASMRMWVASKKTFAPDLKALQCLLGKNHAPRATRTGARREEARKLASCNERWNQAALAKDEGKLAAGSGRRATRAD